MLPRLSPSRLVYTTTSRGIERSRAHIPRGTHVTVPSWICVFSDGTPQRRRPAGSETWTCVASQCCCRAAYPCSPASSLYAARNTWKVRNVRTLCFHSYFISLRARAKDAANREYIYIYIIYCFLREHEKRIIIARSPPRRSARRFHPHAYSIFGANVSLRPHLMSRHPFSGAEFRWARAPSARDHFTRSGTYHSTILFRDSTRRSGTVFFPLSTAVLLMHSGIRLKKKELF